MRCRNCNKLIDEYEVFCDDCKKEIKKVSSRSELNELENLIKNSEDQTLEDTIELDDLSNLISDNEEKLDLISESFSQDNKDIDNLTREEKNEFILDEKEDTKITREEKNENIFEVMAKDNEEIKSSKNDNINTSNKKKKVVIISIIVALIVIAMTILYIFFNSKNKSTKRVEVLNYQKIINDYGKSVSDAVKQYKEENKLLPTWQDVADLIKFDEYNVDCEIHFIYQDESIYLSSCKVENEKVRYSYGKEQTEEMSYKKIDIYKGANDYNDKGIGSLATTITCNSDDCKFITVIDKYVIIYENDGNYLYDYENGTLKFGPFNLDRNYYNNFIMYDNTLYGIYYNSSNVYNIYNVKNGKNLKNINGDFEESYSLLLKYGYAVFHFNNEYNFVNLNTGNISYKIKNNIGKIIEDKKNNIVYITTYLNDIDKFKVYNSNGKLLFNGEEFDYINLYDEGLMVANDNNFKLLDSKSNIKVQSKNYDSILNIYDKYIVVLDNQNLSLVDINDKVVAVLFDKYNSNYIIKSSELEVTDNNQLLSILLENKSVLPNEDGHIIKIVYNIKTKELNFSETH